MECVSSDDWGRIVSFADPLTTKSLDQTLFVASASVLYFLQCLCYFEFDFIS